MRILASLVLVLFGTVPLHAKVLDKATQAGGLRVHYKVALPRDYDPEKTYPAILAFPPGSQTMDMVLTTLVQNWAGEGDRRGYIVVIPAAPEGHMFVAEGAKIFPEFLEQLLREYKVRDKRFHVAGMSNGGRSAFHIAASYPQYFISVTGLPGYLPDATAERVLALSKMCVYMHVGELDSGWREQMQEQAAAFRAKGLRVHFTVEKNQGHVMSTLAGPGSARLFDEMKGAPLNCDAR